MGPELFYFIFRGRYLIPALVSLGCLCRLWRERELFGVSGTLFCVWFAVAAAAQFVETNIAVWIAGLLAQVVLAIVLVLKQRLSDIG
jgi:hypothetical protein